MREDLEKRLGDLKRAVEQSIANHNGLLGRVSEVEHFLAELDKPKEEEELSCD